MATKRKKRGSDLEAAAALIHEAILASDPSLKGTRFTLERNKVLNINGARHEIDVFAQTSPGSLYQATFIFECKDWAKPVGTDVVHVLANKVETIRATAGFIVARRITSDAQALLQANPKLRYVRCSTEFSGPLNTAILSHSVRDPLARTVSLRFRGIPPSEHPSRLEWKGKKCRFASQETDFLAVLEPWFDQLVAEDTRRNAAKYVHEGTHPSSLDHRIDFQPGDFVFDGLDVEYVEIRGRYLVTVTKHKPRFKFELDGQGRAISFEPIMDILAGAALEVQVVQRL